MQARTPKTNMASGRMMLKLFMEGDGRGPFWDSNNVAKTDGRSAKEEYQEQ
jgi:hypothetical protein